MCHRNRQMCRLCCHSVVERSAPDQERRTEVSTSVLRFLYPTFTPMLQLCRLLVNSALLSSCLVAAPIGRGQPYTEHNRRKGNTMTTKANKASTLNDSEFRTLLALLEAHTAATLSAARETPLPAI